MRSDRLWPILTMPLLQFYYSRSEGTQQNAFTSASNAELTSCEKRSVACNHHYQRLKLDQWSILLRAKVLSLVLQYSSCR